MLAVRAEHAFDGESFTHGGVTVLCVDGRIAGVERGHPEMGPPWQVLAVPGGTVLPGLIDTHVHLVGDSKPGALDRVAGCTEVELDQIITEGLRRQLAGGVSTVRDLGDRNWNVVVRRDGQRRTGTNQGARVFAPTILASGPPVTSVGGHCHYLGGEVAGADQIVGAVRSRAERGVDIVKVMASGGMTTPGTDVLHTQFTDEEMALLVSTAHRLGLPVTAHAHGLPAVLQAVACGVDGIEHCSCVTETGVDVPDELMEILASRQIPVGAALGTPPVSAMMAAPPAVRRMMARAGITPEQVRGLRLRTVGRMHRAGVRFVAGGDSGISEWMSHGALHRSVEFLAEAGATVSEALAAATSTAARACGVDDRKGRLRNGFDADLLVVQGDLSADVDAVGVVRAVVVAGDVVG